MKKALLAVAALSCMGSAALAGPNSNGTLIAALSVGTVYTTDNTGYCGSSTTTDCNAAVTSVGGTDPAVINIIAAIGGSPRLAGLTFGINYSAGVSILEGGTCGDFELPDGSWPASGSGNAVTFSSAQTGNLTEVYWFAAYNYYGGAETLALGPHPTQGGNFADDDVPSNIDPITGFGTFGFNAPGNAPCPGTGPLRGACCFPDGSCLVLTADECGAGGGSYQGDNTACETVVCDQPDPTGACCIPGALCEVLTAAECEARGGDYIGDDVPCDPTPCSTPTIESSWGEIKNNYR
jgi:hypothetical protein